MVQPCENQKHDWPLLQTSEPFVHLQVYGSIQPVGGYLPPSHAGKVLSIEFLLGGMMSEA